MTDNQPLGKLYARIEDTSQYLGSREQWFYLQQILTAEDGSEDPGELGSRLSHP
jgi:hypothetical protein